MMNTARVGLGRRGEQLAAEALEQRGFALIARNWRCAEGEVDLIAVREDQWYFFEVRARRGNTQGTPEESATPRKRARMETVARRYLGEMLEVDVVWHLGFVAVEMDVAGRLLRITIYPDLEGEPL